MNYWEQGCDQVYCVDLPLRIHTEFISHFQSFIPFYMHFRSLHHFLEIKRRNQIKNGLHSDGPASAC
jgi:hypothetical protein